MSECNCATTRAAVMDTIRRGDTVGTVRECPIHAEENRRQLEDIQLIPIDRSVYAFDSEDWLLAAQKAERELDRLLTAEGRKKLDRALEDHLILGYN